MMRRRSKRINKKESLERKKEIRKELSKILIYIYNTHILWSIKDKNKEEIDEKRRRRRRKEKEGRKERYLF